LSATDAFERMEHECEAADSSRCGERDSEKDENLILECKFRDSWCAECSQYLYNSHHITSLAEYSRVKHFLESNVASSQGQEDSRSSRTCSICLGVLCSPSFFDHVKNSILPCLSEYSVTATQTDEDVEGIVREDGNRHTYNRFAFRLDPPTLVLPADIAYRYDVARRMLVQATNGAGAGTRSVPTAVFATIVKDRAKKTLWQVLEHIEQTLFHLPVSTASSMNPQEYPDCVHKEEQGFLGIHIISNPSHGVYRPESHLPANSVAGTSDSGDEYGEGKKRKKKRRIRYREFQSQGGDPQTSLLYKLQRLAEEDVDDGTEVSGDDSRSRKKRKLNNIVWSLNRVLDGSVRFVGNGAGLHLHSEIRSCVGHVDSYNAETILLDLHVAVWRRPFYLKGFYTKSRRDVSQTPFFVFATPPAAGEELELRTDTTAELGDSSCRGTSDHDSTVLHADTEDSCVMPEDQSDDGKNDVPNKNRCRLGITSVEEQILQVVEKYCHGVSTSNNDPTTSKLAYGKCKFHASGREDMDVRMLCPAFVDSDCGSSNGSTGHNSGPVHASQRRITGRPFVCEITDSRLLFFPSALPSIVSAINHAKPPANYRVQADGTTPTTTNREIAASDIDDGAVVEISQSSPNISRWSPYGSNPLGVDIAPDFSFAPASAFGALQAETEDKVKHYGCYCWSELVLPTSDELLTEMLGVYPLTIQQRTPVRVLHRRPNVIRTRRVLTCRATRVDAHFFWLHLSTEAGTYVKEFVHGDLGRTVPSICQLLQCNTDLLELDCEGIEA
jgi:tRNA U54 and U55 pseudouridine synthase Pus10